MQIKKSQVTGWPLFVWEHKSGIQSIGSSLTLITDRTLPISTFRTVDCTCTKCDFLINWNWMRFVFPIKHSSQRSPNKLTRVITLDYLLRWRVHSLLSLRARATTPLLVAIVGDITFMPSAVRQRSVIRWHATMNARLWTLRQFIEDPQDRRPCEDMNASWRASTECVFGGGRRVERG